MLAPWALNRIIVASSVSWLAAETQFAGVRMLENNGTMTEAPAEEDKSVGQIVLDFAIIVVLVLLSGMFSGLTLGLLGLDTNQLQIVAEAGDAVKAENARKILPLRRRGNLLLTTLLLGNVAVNALLSIFLASYTNGFIGFILSTALIVVFGEILPQATCSRFPLYIGAKAIPLVLIIGFFLLPLTYPMSLALDWLLGEEVGDLYSRNELHELITQHVKSQMLEEWQGQFMQGAIQFGRSVAGDIMTPREDIFVVKSTDRLDYTLMAEIFRRGHSRIPVFAADDENMVEGVLYAKDLMMIVPAQKTPVATVTSFFGRGKVTRVNREDPLPSVLKKLKEDQRALAVVEEIDNSGDGDPVRRICGLVTMEDIVEAILQTELVDEYDTAVSLGGAATGRQQIPEARLRQLTDVSTGFNDLSESMVAGVAAHLAVNVETFKEVRDGVRLSQASVAELVKASRVIELAPSDPRLAPLLFERGEPPAWCAVILEGTVRLTSGNDSIRSEAGTYDVLAQKTLLSADYRPDFSAQPSSQRVRLLCITRAAFEDAFRISRLGGGAIAPSLTASGQRTPPLPDDDGEDGATGIAAAAAGSRDVRSLSAAQQLEEMQAVVERTGMESTGLMARYERRPRSNSAARRRGSGAAAAAVPLRGSATVPARASTPTGDVAAVALVVDGGDVADQPE